MKIRSGVRGSSSTKRTFSVISDRIIDKVSQLSPPLEASLTRYGKKKCRDLLEEEENSQDTESKEPLSN